MWLGGLKKYALGAGGMLALVTAIVLATGSGRAVAAQITSVFVTNTPSNPVPVKETSTDANGNIKVHEQGTANANITNTDANGNVKVHEQGTANVNLTNSSVPVREQGTPNVTVSNGTASPIPTKSIDEPGRQPFVVEGTVTVQDGQTGSFDCPAFVPSGKRAVLQYVDATVNHFPTDEHVDAQVLIQNDAHSVVMQQFGNGHPTVNARVFLLAPAGDVVCFGFNRALFEGGSLSGAIIASYSITGYLIDAS